MSHTLDYEFGSRAGRASSNALVNQSGEKAGVNGTTAPFGIKSRARLGRHDLVLRFSLFLESGDIFPDGDEHIVEFLELGFAADGTTVSRNDDCLVRRCRKVGGGSGDHSVDAAASRIVDERVDAIPIGIAGMQDVRLAKGRGNVAIGVRGRVRFQSDGGAVEL